MGEFIASRLSLGQAHTAAARLLREARIAAPGGEATHHVIAGLDPQSRAACSGPAALDARLKAGHDDGLMGEGRASGPIRAR